MSILLDAFALVALLLDEPAAEETEAVLRRGGVATVAVNLAEAVDVLVRREQIELDRVRAVLGPVIEERTAVIAVDGPLAWRAAELRARHYHRSRSPLSLADCMLLAAAAPRDSIATADRALARAARAESREVRALPDSAGRFP